MPETSVIKKSSLAGKLIWITVFAVAMGLFEAILVVFLEEIVLPSGMFFPLHAVYYKYLDLELWRELATVVILASAGILAGNKGIQRFAFFVFAFAIWDIFYYVFLYLAIGFPPDIFSWDLLFVLPVFWIGPVIAPLLVALLMVIFSLTALVLDARNYAAGLKWKEGAFFVSGCFFVFISFIMDYMLYLYNMGNGFQLHFYSDLDQVVEQLRNYTPTVFNWPVYITGLLLIITGYIVYTRRVIKTREKHKEILTHM